MDFSYQFENQDDNSSACLVLNGYLDEFAQLPDDHNFSQYSQVSIDFGGVDFINSGGIKLWVNFIDELERLSELKILFKNCHRVIIEQVNMIEGFLPKNGQVDSLFIPVFCNKCENSIEVFREVSKLSDTLDEITNLVDDPGCGDFPSCRKEFEVDIIPEQFLRFRKS